MSKEAGNSKIFYGWFIVAACCAVTLTLGEAFWTFGIFFKPLENEFGWSRTITSSGYTTFLIGYAISVIIAGRFVDRHSPRPILLVSAVLAGLGLALCSQVHSINQLRIILFIAGLGAGATWTVPTSTVQRWFYRRPKAGLALAIVVAGVGVGGMIFAPLINYLILSYGWRNSYIIIGILFSATIALSALVIRRSPAQVSHAGEGEKLAEPVDAQGWTTGRAVTSLPFITVTFVVCIGILTFHVLAVHLVPYATDIGISPTVAATALGLIGGLSVPGRFISGFLWGKLGWQKLLAFSMLATTIPILFLLFLKNSWMLYGFVCVYGLFHGGRVPAQVGILGEFFGMRSLGELIGIVFAAAYVSAAVAPYVAGFIFDVTGSYFIAFLLLIGLLLCGGLAALMVKKPAITRE